MLLRLILICLPWMLFSAEKRVGQLENGFSYYIHNCKERNDKISIRLMVRTGFLQERADQRGAAHFIEHLVFRGTENISEQEITNFYQSLGLSIGREINAYTSFLETVYQFDLYSRSIDDLDKVLSYFRTAVSHLDLSVENIERERGIILNEFHLRSGPRQRLVEKLWSIEYASLMGVEQFPLADEDAILSLSAEKLTEFYKKWYDPERIGIIIVGDFDVDLIYEKVNTLFGSLPAQGKFKEEEKPSLPKKGENKVNILTDCEQSQTVLLIKCFFERQEGAGALTPEGKMLKEMAIYLLRRRLQMKKYSPQSPYHDADLHCYLSFDPIVECLLTVNCWLGDYKRALHTILSEIKRIKTYGFSDKEIEVAKQYCKRFIHSDNRFQHEIIESYLNRFLQKQSEPNIDPSFDLEKITASTLNQFVTPYIDHSDWSITLMLSKKEEEKPKPEKLQSFIDHCFEQRVANHSFDPKIKPSFVPPPKGEILKTRYYGGPNVYDYYLSNGARVLFCPGYSNIYIGAMADFGIASLPKSHFDSAYFANLFHDHAFLEDLGDAAENVRYSHELQLNMRRFVYVCPKNHLDLTLSLICKLFSGNKHSKRGWFRTKRMICNQKILNLVSSQTRFFQHVRERNFPGPLFCSPCPKKICQKKVEQILRACYSNPAEFTFVIYGDLQPLEVEKLIEKYIASIPSQKMRLKPPVLSRPKPKGKCQESLFCLGTEKKSFTVMSFSPEYSKIRGVDKYDLYFTSELIKKRLYDFLRRTKGACYYVSTYLSMPFIPSLFMTKLFIEFSCLQSDAKALIEETKGELNRLLLSGFTEREIAVLGKIYALDERKAAHSSLKQMRLLLNTAHRGLPLKCVFHNHRVTVPKQEAVERCTHLLLGGGCDKVITWMQSLDTLLE